MWMYWRLHSITRQTERASFHVLQAVKFWSTGRGSAYALVNQGAAMQVANCQWGEDESAMDVLLFRLIGWPAKWGTR